MGNKLQIVTIGISSVIVLLLIYNTFLIQPNIFLEIGIASAEQGKARVETDYSKIEILSYPVESSETIRFQVKIVNDGGSSAKNFFIKMNFQPSDPDWLNPSTVPIQTQNYLSCSLALANACHIGIIQKNDSVILEFVGSIDPRIYKEVIDKNPRIEFSYGYDGSETITKTVEIKLAGLR